MKPLAIDLFAGLGGWSDGLLKEGWRVIGFDIERHVYGDHRYPAQLVLQDVRTIHGSQFKGADLIVASPPCQAYSYMAMPWTRAKAMAADYRAGRRDVKELTALFDACFRIQCEASEAAGRHIPMVVENVRGAQPWVGRAQANFGSFYLWGDVPALMPIVTKARKVPGFRFDGSGKSFQSAAVSLGDGVKAGDRNRTRASGGHAWDTDFAATVERATKNTVMEAAKTAGHVNRRDGYSHTRHLTNQAEHDAVKHGGDWFSDPDSPGRQGGVKQAGLSGPRNNGKGDAWFQDGAARHGSKSSARKAASARIAKIPERLARWIARYYYPDQAKPERAA